MWIHHYTKMYRGINPEDVWNIWSDINNWKDWLSPVQESQLDEIFSPNASFKLQFKNESPITYKIIKIFDGYKFISMHTFFGAKLYDTRALDTSIEGVRLVRTITISGPLTWLWKYKISKNIIQNTKIELEALATKAQHVFYKNLSQKTDISLLKKYKLEFIA